MKVKVTAMDIECGRSNLSEQCGCPIWHVLVGALRLPVGDDLKFKRYDLACIGKIEIHLPRKAEKWQLDGLKDHGYSLLPFTFTPRISVKK